MDFYQLLPFKLVNKPSDYYNMDNKPLFRLKNENVFYRRKGEIVMDEENQTSYFDGGVFDRLGWKILGSLLTAVTLGICYPVAICWMYAWEAKHTVINGRRLKFTGTAGGLFGTWILCWLLTIVTLGIYGFYVPFKIKKWKESNTFFEDEVPTFDAVQKLKKDKASYFDGGFWQFFGWKFLGGFITIITLGICYPWAIKMLYSWEQRHKVYCDKRCTFDGTAIGLFGTWIVCMLLTIITLGIYSFWVPIKIEKWIVSHTRIQVNVEEKKNPEVYQSVFDSPIFQSKFFQVISPSIAITIFCVLMFLVGGFLVFK